MTLLSTQSRVAYAGNGTTKTFSFPFKIWAPSDLKIYLRQDATGADTLMQMSTDYAVDVSAYPSSGSVTFSVAPPGGVSVIILRDVPPTQELDLIPSGAFAAENIEVQLDKLAAEIQTLREIIARTPRLSVGTQFTDLAWPEPRPVLANQLLAINAAGDGYELKLAANLPVPTVSSFIGTLLDDPDAATARATLGLGGAIDLNLLTSDATGGAHNDFVPFVDASEANASNKVSVANLFSAAIANATDTLPSDQNAFEVLARRLADNSLHRMLLSRLGTGKQTIWLPASALIVRATNSPASGSIETAVNKVMLRTLDFDPAIAEYAQVTVQMPKGWNEGTLTALFVWSHAATAANFNVVWAIRGLALSDDDAIDAAFGASVQVTDSGGTANDLYRSPETPAFNLAGSPQENDVAMFEIFRAAGDPADTLAVDARLHGVAIFYTTNANTDN